MVSAPPAWGLFTPQARTAGSSYRRMQVNLWQGCISGVLSFQNVNVTAAKHQLRHKMPQNQCRRQPAPTAVEAEQLSRLCQCGAGRHQSCLLIQTAWRSVLNYFKIRTKKMVLLLCKWRNKANSVTFRTGAASPRSSKETQSEKETRDTACQLSAAHDRSDALESARTVTGSVDLYGLLLGQNIRAQLPHKSGRFSDSLLAERVT